MNILLLRQEFAETALPHFSESTFYANKRQPPVELQVCKFTPHTSNSSITMNILLLRQEFAVIAPLHFSESSFYANKRQ